MYHCKESIVYRQIIRHLAAVTLPFDRTIQHTAHTSSYVEYLLMTSDRSSRSRTLLRLSAWLMWRWPDLVLAFLEIVTLSFLDIIALLLLEFVALTLVMDIVPLSLSETAGLPFLVVFALVCLPLLILSAEVLRRLRRLRLCRSPSSFSSLISLQIQWVKWNERVDKWIRQC